MKKRFYILVGLLLVTLSLVACGGGGVGRELPPSASEPAANLRVAEKREIEVEDARIQSLSPDGNWLLVHKNGVLCIYQAEPLQMQSCAELEGGPADLRNVAWSPDGTRVAFTEDFIRLFFESDLWVLEVASGKLTNLTDDGVERFELGSEADFQADLSPSWSPDGRTLLFSRSPRAEDEWQGTTLGSIPAGGGDPDKVLSVTAEEPASVWTGVRWSADGEKLLYTVSRRESDHPDNGIWIADQDGKNPEHLLGVTDPEMGPPFLADVADSGDKALVWYFYAAGRFATKPNVSFFALLDLSTGDVEPLKQAQGEEAEFFGPTDAIFAPGGVKVLYVYHDIGGEYKLVVRDVDGGDENVLLAAEEPLGVSRGRERGLDWADDDTVYVGTIQGSAFLLTIETE